MARAGTFASVSAARLASLAALLLVTACAPGRGLPPASAGPEAVARAYLDAWERGDTAAQRDALGAAGAAEAEAQQARWRQALGVTASRFDGLRVVSESETFASVSFRAVHTLRGLGDWPVTSQLRLERQEGRWRVLWAAAVLHPATERGDTFVRQRTWGPRAPLLDADGRPLTVPGEVVTIGVEPRRVRDAGAVAEALRTHVGVEPARVHAALAGARPDAFVGLIDLRLERYQAVRPALAPVPGVVFRKRAARLSPAEGFAAHTLGRVGEVTAEALAALGAPYQAGDVVGLSGLERELERRLAGRPTGEVLRVRGAERLVLHRFEGEDGTAVRTTLRRDVQAAAEAALADVTQPAALVAVDARTGDVVAVASRPLSVPLHRALTGRYAPGSTFKLVTAEALLARGLTPESRVACPAEASAGGKRFRNFEGEALGDTTLRGAFAHSCNTTFVPLAAQLGTDALRDAARRFGFDTLYTLGLPSPGASFPEPADDAERAAAAIGQGRVLATPVHLASVAAAVHDGVWRAPRLLPELDGPRASLTRDTAPALRALLRAVVTEGTARAAADVPGLLGKTGTAEYGTTQPPATHAWFIGVHGHLGFAVLVEGGGVGGRVAVPLAARFVRALGPAR